MYLKKVQERKLYRCKHLFKNKYTIKNIKQILFFGKTERKTELRRKGEGINKAYNLYVLIIYVIFHNKKQKRKI